MKTFAILLVATLAAFTGVAHAEESVRVRERAVHLDGLDLDDRTDVRRLYRRISRAARDVCGTSDLMLSTAVNAQTCTGDAIARAVADVNAPLLTDYFVARGGVFMADATQLPSEVRVVRN